MALNQSYHQLWFISSNQYESGHKWWGCLKLFPGQVLPAEITAECESRGIDPFTLITQCSRDFKDFTNPNYPEGTKFLLKAMLNDRESGGLFFTSPYAEQPLKVENPT